MADDNVAIATGPATTTAGTVTLIKTFSVKDGSGNTVEAQAVVLVDEFGDALERPMTEATGQRILNMLININNVLAESTGAGLRYDQKAVDSAGTD